MHARILQQIRRSSTAAPKAVSIPDFLRTPTWSVSYLLPPPCTTPETTDAPITRTKLRHLLRLSALPPPPSPEAEAELLSALHAHLHFVRAAQAVDTVGVEPLARVEDEVERNQITWKEVAKTTMRRERFEHGMREQGRVSWEPMRMARKAVGGFYVVDEKVTEELEVEVEAEGEGKGLPLAGEALPEMDKA